MGVFFLDSSALVKRYVLETGSRWIRDHTDPETEHHSYVALIAGAEVVAALMRQQRTRALSAEDAAKAIAAFRQEFDSLYHVVAITEEVVAEAMELTQTHPLRGYDAVQLAAALQIQLQRKVAGLKPLTFISADTNLNDAASREGFAVENPNQHD